MPSFSRAPKRSVIPGKPVDLLDFLSVLDLIVSVAIMDS
jgi:hypothetical protein